MQHDLELIARLRDEYRDSEGFNFPDPVDGAPMVGTGLCHYVCMDLDVPGVSMTGGWFRHDDGFDYDHSWWIDDNGNIVDPTADQWHLGDFPGVCVIEPGDVRYSRYIVGKANLTEEGFVDTDEMYLVPEGFAPNQPPSDPYQRGTHLTASQRACGGSTSA